MRAIASLVVGLLFVVQAWANPQLHGTWSAANVNGRPLLVEFKPDGSGQINGEPMRWQTLGPILAIEQNGDAAGYGFEVQGNKLHVSGGDLPQPATLTKGRAAYDTAMKSQGKNAKGVAPAQAGAQSSVRSNGQELVGKWCDVRAMSNSQGGSSRMECFTLNPDGTYTYSFESSRTVTAGSTASQASDAGRWSYDGARLTAQSRSGKVSNYALEKRNHPKNKRDPMICLDGACYVTYYNKPAW